MTRKEEQAAEEIYKIVKSFIEDEVCSEDELIEHIHDLYYEYNEEEDFYE